MLISEAIGAWESGRLVAIPTETVYGLGAPVNNIKLVHQIFAVKERPFFDPLIVHVSSIDMAKKYCTQWGELAHRLATEFWPGPLTMVMPKSELIDSVITSGLETVGLRIPNNQLSIDLINTVGVGVAAPSANKFTKTSPTTADHVRDQFSDRDVYVLEDDPSEVGIESTIVSINQDENHLTILRPGILTAHDFKEFLGDDISIEYGKTAFESNQKVEAPGQFKAHYRPEYELSYETKSLELSEYQDRFKDIEFHELSSDPYVTARELYASMRTSLKNGFKKKCFLIPEQSFQLSEKEKEVWQGILNRLSKASTFTLSK